MNRSLVVLTALATLGMPVVAQARKGSPKTQARALYKEGKRQFQRRSYAAAVQAYKRSYALFPHRNTLYNIALSLAHQGRRGEAYGYLQRYQAQATPKDPPLDDILKRVWQGFGVLVVEAPVSDAGVYADGRLLGRGRIKRVLPSGTRALEIRQGIRVVVRKMLDLPGGKVTHWPLGAVRVKAARPGDGLFIDGQSAAKGAVHQVVEAGERVVEVRRDQRVVARKTLRVSAGQTVDWTLGAGPVDGGSVTPKKRSSRTRLHWAWFTTFAALTVGAAVGATVTSFETKRIWDDFKADRTNVSLADKGDRMQLTANVLWGVTGAFGVATVLIAIFTRWRKPAERPEVTWSPLLGPGAAGATVTWRH